MQCSSRKWHPYSTKVVIAGIGFDLVSAWPQKSEVANATDLVSVFSGLCSTTRSHSKRISECTQAAKPLGQPAGLDRWPPGPVAGNRTMRAAKPAGLGAGRRVR